MANTEAYRAVIADVERIIADLEARLLDARQTRDRLRALVGESAPPSNGASHHRRLPNGALRRVPAADKPKRGVTTGIVFNAIKRREGMTSEEIIEVVAPQFTHLTDERRRRKLASSIIGHLRDTTHRIRKDPEGRYYAVT